jgi:transcriptional regulator with XRE-family HTH domain
MSDLKSWREGQKISRADLGEKLGVTAVAVGRYESGRVPEPAVLQRLIEITAGDVTANDFFDIPQPAEASKTGEAA